MRVPPTSQSPASAPTPTWSKRSEKATPEPGGDGYQGSAAQRALLYDAAGSLNNRASGVLDELMRKGDAADLSWIDRYNTVFMLDDSHATTAGDWQRIEATLTQLLPLAAAHDQDGIDVLFAARGTAVHLKSSDDITRFLGGLRKTANNANISASMTHYLEQYANRITDSHTDRSSAKPLNLIVLSSQQPDAAGQEALVAAAKRMDRAGVAPRQLRVQFAIVSNTDATRTAAERFNTQFAGRHEIRDMAEQAVISGKESVADLARKVLVGKLAPRGDA